MSYQREDSIRFAETAEESDLDLVRLALAEGDAPSGMSAASRLLRRYQRRVYAWCYRYVGNHERALDLAQDVLLRAYRSLGTYEGRSQFSSWIFVIARNRCLTELQKPALLHEEDVDESRLASPRSHPEEEFLERSDHDALIAVIQEVLEPREQEVLWLRCFERMPLGAITELLELEGVSGARAVLQRARRKLRAALDARVARAERVRS